MEPNDSSHYDSRAEEAIDWYKHYMSLQMQDLIADYVARSIRDEREVSESLRMAMQDRMEEMEKWRSEL